MPTLGRCRIAFYTSIQLTQPNCPRSAQLGHPAPVTPSPNFKKKIVTPSPPPQPHRIQIQIATAGNRVAEAAMAQVAAASSSGTWRLAVAAAASSGMARRRLGGIPERPGCEGCRVRHAQSHPHPAGHSRCACSGRLRTCSGRTPWRGCVPAAWTRGGA